MPKNIDIKLNVETSGDGKIQALTMSTQDLERATLAAARTFKKQQDKLAGNAIKASAYKTALDGLDSAMRSITAVTSELTDAYAVQEQAETQLATVMRQRMDASEADIDAIKKLASAQQELGVIGDEVQLAGAQQVATFLTMRSSLETLLPAMNDLVAQQRGLSATSTDAVSVANLMGKAMQGQTSALRRVGISFSEAQAEVMKTGTEMERAAMLAKIITDNVGHMNAELAKTDAGRLKQLSNTLGDAKEQAGKAIQSIQPYIALAAQLTTASTGVMKLAKGFSVLTNAVIPASIAQQAENIALASGETIAKKYALGTRAAAVATTTLKVAIKGLLISSVVGIAVVALTSALEWFMNSGDDVADNIDGVTEASRKLGELARETAQIFEQTEHQVNTAIQAELVELKKLIVSKGDASDMVERLNQKYKDSFGTYKTAAEWYKVLAKNAAIYAKVQAGMALQVEYEARKAKMEADKQALEQQQAELLRHGDVQLKPYGKDGKNSKKTGKDAGRYIALGKAINSAEGDLKDLDDLIKANEKEVDAWTAKIEKVDYAETETPSNKGVDKQKEKTLVYKEGARTLEDYEHNLCAIEQALKRTDPADVLKVQRLKELRRETLALITATRELLGLEGDYSDRVRHPGESVRRIEPDSGPLAPRTKKPETLDISRNYARELASWSHTDEIADAVAELREMQKLDRAEYIVRVRGMGFDRLTSRIKELQRMLADTENPMPDEQRRSIEQLLQAYTQWRRDSISAFDSVREGWAGIQGIGGGIQGLTDALRGNASAWERVQGVINSTLQIMSAVQSVVALVDKLTTAFGGEKSDNGASRKAAASEKSAEAQTAEAVSATAVMAVSKPLQKANKATSNSFLEIATAAYLAAHAKIPFAGFAIGAGFASAATALVKSVGAMKFADGGIISGPTLGLMGEYAGASRNPEVVAPLDRLRAMLRPQSAPVIVGGRLRVHGRELVCLLENESRISAKSGRITRI